MNKPDFISSLDNSWSLFLDRDGVINKRIFGGYVVSTDEFEFLPGVLKSLTRLSKIFNRIIIVTNQQGVGKGLMTEQQLNIVHSYMTSKISHNGGRIDGIYYCTDLADKENNCRKPNNALAKRALIDFPDIDFNKSIMVGDSLSDIKFGMNSGMKTVFVTSSEINDEAIQLADMAVKDLEELTNQII